MTTSNLIVSKSSACQAGFGVGIRDSKGHAAPFSPIALMAAIIVRAATAAQHAGQRVNCSSVASECDRQEPYRTG